MANNTVIVRQHVMVEKSCYSCGFPFMVPDWFEKQCREKGRSWCCPSCCENTVYCEPEISKLKRQLAERSAYWHAQYEREREQHQLTTNSLHTTKGHLTRMRKRLSAGVCPCCHRSFQNVSRHIASKHPEFALDG